MHTIRNRQGRLASSPDENVPDLTLQASCKRISTRLRAWAAEAAIGLIWAVLALVSIAVLLGSDGNVVDFRYVGF